MNTRFAVAVHILTYLAARGGTTATSEELATSVGTHPALIRRICGQLAQAGLVRSQRGPSGGCLLGRPAGRIRLVDVYRAAAGDEECAVIRVHDTSNRRCPVGRHMPEELAVRVAAAERALERELARTTIHDLASALVPSPAGRS